MSPQPTTIRVHIHERNAQQKSAENAQVAFWLPLRQEADDAPYADTPLEQLEGQLERQVGEHLHEKLVSMLREASHPLEGDWYDSRFYRLLEREYMHRERGADPFGSQALDAFVRMAEAREQSVRDMPALREGREKIALAGRVVFRVRIAAYGSLDLDITSAPLNAVAKVFDFDIAAFEVFLGAYVPVALGDVFTDTFADRFRFDVHVPASVGAAFRAAEAAVRSAAAPSIPLEGAGPPAMSDSQRKAEILWRVANGSLLIPVVLALAVMLYGFRAVADVQRSQFDAVKPILEHQVTLLREDRERLAAIRPDSFVRQAGTKRP